MLSFIVIGRDVEKTIEICIKSIFQFVRANQINAYEIIYVDSDSKDNTINIAKHYPIRILQIKGKVNAAIGRNTGAQNARYDILFFVDGDMELLPDFYEDAFDHVRKKLKYPFINGFLRHKFYDKNFNYLFSRDEDVSKSISYSTGMHGIMIVAREHWNGLNGMDERLIRNEDIDLGLRSTRKGCPAMVLNRFIAVHHTVSYFNGYRAQYFLLSKVLFSSGLLMRKHLLNIAYYKKYPRNTFYVLILFSSLFSFFFLPIIGTLLFILYVLLQLGRIIKNMKKEENLLNSFMYKFFFNVYTLCGFFFYFPSKPKYDLYIIS